jgi:hypothetical protein
MDLDTLIGCLLVAGALGVLTGLVLWSRRSIERIARTGFGSVREIRDEEEHDD